jgi:hypothetical protein
VWGGVDAAARVRGRGGGAAGVGCADTLMYVVGSVGY